MIISENPVQHLTYCLNVHPGEDWDSNFASIKKYALEIRRRVALGQPFGLGMRLSRIAADELIKSNRLAEFRSFLKKHNLYVFTINGFPYGQFHGTAVKESVYQPDWATEERVVYTNLLADILAQLLPDGVMGSISTVPGGYGEKLKAEKLKTEMGMGERSEVGDQRSEVRGQRAEVRGQRAGGCGQWDVEMLGVVADNIARCAEYFAGLEMATGKHIVLAMEPEPDCLFDTTESTVTFFNEVLAGSDAVQRMTFDWRRYIGVCFDTCHMSVVFEDPAEGFQRLLDNGITIAKVQISAALRAETGKKTAEHLAEFSEHVYLHQTRLRGGGGEIRCYPDLTDEALGSVTQEGGEVRVHMHVPLYFVESGSLRSTANDLTEQFFEKVADAGIPHLEIETYTFDVLPDELSDIPIEDSIEREFQVVKSLFSVSS